MAPKVIRSWYLEPINVTWFGKKGPCKYDWIKDLEMERFSWTIWVGPKWNPMYPYNREVEEDDRQKRRRQCDHGGRDWSNVATSQGMPAATSSWRRQGTDSTLDAPGGAWPCWHLDVGSVKLILDFWSSELLGNTLRVFFSYQICGTLLWMDTSLDALDSLRAPSLSEVYPNFSLNDVPLPNSYPLSLHS